MRDQPHLWAIALVVTIGVTCAALAGGAPAALAQAAAPNAKAPGRFGLQDRSGLDADARDYLGTPQTEAATKRALAYLASKQLEDGSWPGNSYTGDVGIAGLCALAFMAAGHQPDRGPYGQVLRNATDYLAENSQRSGLIYNPNASSGPPMYGHGFATLALAELYGMTRRADLRDKLERAIELILRTQNDEGGWRYQPRVADADISVVICQIMALRAAHNAGVKVPRDTLERAVEYVKSCFNPSDGGFSYMPVRRDSGLARTGAGVLSLIVMGEDDSDEVKGGLTYLLDNPPSTRENHEFYAHYYCTQAAYQAGGKYWRFWYPKLAEQLTRDQRPDGSWYDGPGYPYATAMGVLALQVPASLLPIYQK